MKLIVAIIRPDRLNEVLEALYRTEVRGLTVSRVLGHGGETERVETYRGTTVKMELAEKVRFEIAVSARSTRPPSSSPTGSSARAASLSNTVTCSCRSRFNTR